MVKKRLPEPTKEKLTEGNGDLDLERDLQKFQKEPNLKSTRLSSKSLDASPTSDYHFQNEKIKP